MFQRGGGWSGLAEPVVLFLGGRVAGKRQRIGNRRLLINRGSCQTNSPSLCEVCRDGKPNCRLWTWVGEVLKLERKSGGKLVKKCTWYR